MDFGPWTLDLGPWTLDFGPWTLDLGLALGLALGHWAWTLDLGHGPWTNFDEATARQRAIQRSLGAHEDVHFTNQRLDPSLHHSSQSAFLAGDFAFLVVCESLVTDVSNGLIEPWRGVCS